LSKSPILVTGMHRSGTTWVGRMLAASREAVYFHEPLNPDCSPALLRRSLETTTRQGFEAMNVALKTRAERTRG